jgi:hypothetical protein
VRVGARHTQALQAAAVGVSRSPLDFIVAVAGAAAACSLDVLLLDPWWHRGEWKHKWWWCGRAFAV